jgi:FixJ family two-component response regulator
VTEASTVFVVDDDPSVRRSTERLVRSMPREREVMAHVVAGLANKQIAGELATTERAINFHRAHLMEKMEAASLAELVQMGGQLGSSPPESRAGPVPKDR